MPYGEKPIDTIETILPVMPSPPIASSRGRNWGGVTIDLYGAQPHADMTCPALDHHLVLCIRSGGGRLLQRRDGQVCDSPVGPGMAIVVPAGCESFWLGHIPACIGLRIPVALLEQAAAQIEGNTMSGTVRLRNVFGVHDWLIDRLSAILLAEVHKPSHPSQGLIVDATSSALAGHLLREYRPCDAIAANGPPGLAARALKNVLKYIEGNLAESVTLAELANTSNLSRFYFARLFKISTGLSPMAYLERARLERAQDLIRKGGTPLAEVALSVGYADQSHFTRRFSRQVGTTPAAFGRDNGSRRPQRKVHRSTSSLSSKSQGTTTHFAPSLH